MLILWRKKTSMRKNDEFLYNLLKKEYKEEDVKQILAGSNIKRPLTFRVNTLKSSRLEIEEFLNSEKINYKLVPWYSDAFIIMDDIKIQEYPIYKEGKIYLQSLSSMLPVLFLDLEEKDSILDMAASPGGKTTQIAALTNNSALITAVEKNKIRGERLKYNIELQGAKRVNVMLCDARKIDDCFKFDKILLDAPCSGSGTINLNDENLEKKFNKDLIDRSIKTQELLLKKALKLLKRDGILIYSTCSILKEENEQNIKKVLQDDTVELVPINKKDLADIPLLLTTIEGVICVRPSELYEGFFVAKLRKK